MEQQVSDARTVRSRRGLRTCLLSTFLLIAAAVWPGSAALAAGEPPTVFDTFAFGTTERPISVFLSGFDPDGEVITYSVDSGPANGVLTDDCSDGVCTYTSDTGFVGTDTFTYTASDGDLTSPPATATIEVQADVPPDVFDGFFTTKVDQAVSIFLSGFDNNGDPVTFAIDTPPANGALDDCSTGSCTYTPDTGFIGLDSFTFTGSDGTNVSTPATVSIDVRAEAPPEAFDSSASTNQDVPVSVFLSATDPNGDALTYSIVSGPTSGSLTDCTSGFCSYTPDTGFLGTDSFSFTASDGVADSNTATVTIDVLPPCAPATCIDNGTVLLAVNPEAQLNTTDASGSAAGPGDAGLHFIPTGNESTSPGCLCEGWGAADATSGVTGYANVSVDGVNNLDRVSFTTTSSTAVSEVTIDDTMRVTHDFHPSADTDNLYEVTVTIENISAAPLDDIRYRRVMDWDIEPTPFAEFVTIDGGDAANLLFSSDDGFASGNPLAGPTQIDETGSFVDSGPNDHGALFDFGFGAVAAGESVTFNIYYGAAATESEAISAVAAVSAEVFSFGQPSTVDGPTLGTPNTFIFAFAGVGGDPVFAPLAVDDELTTAAGTPGVVDVLANDSDPNGDPIEVTSWTDGTNGTVTCTPAGVCTYTPAPGFSGSDSFTYTIEDGTGGSATATVAVTVTAPSNDPPVVSAGDGGSGVEGSPIALSGSATDPDGDTLTLAWTYTADAGVDAGATCSFSTPAAASTDITCTDDGTYTATLTADDGVNAPVSASTTVTVSNADPTVNITAPSDGAGFNTGAAVNLSATLADAGANDTHTCSIDWGDGTVTTGTVATGTCTGSHAYGAAGATTVTVTVTDDDGGTGTDSIGLTITAPPSNDPPVVSAGDGGSGVEGSPIALSGSATDPDGDTLTLAWTYTADAGVDAGATCSFSTPAAASTDITCTDDGTYTATLTADDGVNAPVSASTTVTVSNADPTVNITAPSDGAGFNTGAAVNLSATLADAGANDTHTCSIDWGDGTVTTGTVATGTCTGSHAYGAAGATTVTVTVTDDDGGTGTDSIGLTITDAPTAAGLAKGSGWLYDQAGVKIQVRVRAEYVDGNLVGRVRIDSGACFWLPSHDCVHFRSTSVENLVVTGRTATWTGEGRWKKQSGYTYEVTVGDFGNEYSPWKDRDTFAIVIRDASGSVVYSADNRLVLGNFKVK